jgi:hypothetical protein
VGTERLYARRRLRVAITQPADPISSTDSAAITSYETVRIAWGITLNLEAIRVFAQRHLDRAGGRVDSAATRSVGGLPGSRACVPQVVSLLAPGSRGIL